MKLEFRLLGDIAVLADGQPLGLGGTRQRSVLALLVLQRDRPIATELLADRLWPDDQPLSAIKTIQVYVSRLRRALGPAADRLTSSATGYRLAVADDELDATRFERGLRHAREALTAGSPATADGTLEQILELWSGPALGDIAGEQFARREAERLEELRLQAFEELFELRIAAGSGRQTIGELRRLTADQPGRERLWRLLMLALYADGRQSEALEAYQDARRYLADELGLDPGPELRELEHAILTQEAPRPPQTAMALALDTNAAIEPATGSNVAAAEVEPLARRRRVVTVLRADVFRPSDEEPDPELLEALDRRAHDVVRRAVERHGGTIDRADQDGVTAVFGLTAAREDDALRAVRAASELMDSAPVDPHDAIVLRIGVSTGEVMTGPTDTHGHLDSGAPLIGAARLAAVASQGEVLMASETAGLVGGAASTEHVSLERDGEPVVSAAVRLLGVNDGEAIVRHTTTLFVGRSAELDAIVAAIERLLTSEAPGLVTVIGAPGVGKSRLVAESFARISKRALILRSRCLPYGDGITYWPIRDLVLEASGISSSDSQDVAIAKIETVVAGLDGKDQIRNGVASVAGLHDGSIPAEEIRWAVRRFVEALAADRPLVLLVDDLQWAEPVLVELLDHVLDLGHGPVLLVTVGRPELAERRPEWLARPGIELIRLDALDEAEAATLLDHLAPELPPGPLRSRILATAEGNPLFVEQFVGYAADGTRADESGLDGRTDADLSIPPTIGALLAARLDRLPDVERRILEEAAVVGRTFWAGALAGRLSDAERSELPRRLARLAHRELIRPERSVFAGEEAYRFRHLLIRDAAYASLPKRERAELHERFAGWLERRFADHTGEYDLIVGYHLEQAYRYHLELGDDSADVQGLADRALRLIGPAGQAAEERRDPHAAISLLRRAVNLARPGPQRIDLLISLGAALRLAGENSGSDAARAEVEALLAAYPDEGLEYRYRIGSAWWDTEYTPAETQAAYDYYERVGDAMGMVQALEWMVLALATEGRYGEVVDTLDEATDLVLKVGPPDRAATLTASLAWIFYYSDVPVPAVLSRLRRYLELAGTNRFSRMAILMELGRFEAMTDAGDAWRRHFEEAKAIIDDLGLLVPIGLAGYPRRLGSTEVASGEPARVLELLQDSCSAVDRMGGPMVEQLASLAPITADAFLAVGRLEDAEHYASWARDISNSPDEQADWRIAMSRIRSRQGNYDEAVTLAREALEEYDPGWDLVGQARAHMSLAIALRGAGDEPAAVVAAQEARRLATAKQDRAALRRIDDFLKG